MLAAWRRIVPFVLAGVLLLNLAAAISTGDRGSWLLVAILARLLALTVWRRQHVDP